MTVQKTSLTNRSEIFDKEIDKDVRIPAASLARLEAQTIDVKSQNSLLDSLRDSECKAIQPHHLQVHSPSTHIISAASSHLQLGSLTQSGSGVSIPPISSDVVKKKVVIVNKSSDGVKTLKAHEFITKLKENLSDNSFMCFKSSITEYKKSGDIHEFLKQMKTIFNHPSTFQLLQGMSKFVREQHIIDFNQFFTRHTGKTISTEPVSGIKRRIDELGPVLSANKKPYIEL